MLLTGATLTDGREVDVRIRAELIESVEKAGALAPEPDEQTVDLRDHLLIPALAEPHAHLDKAFLSERIANPTGDLMGAILAMQANRHLITVEDTITRAERAVRLMVSNGATIIRTHADTTLENGLSSVEALVEVRRRTMDICELQIVALVSWPITGRPGAACRSLLRDALQAGADLVGGCPHLDEDPHEANETLLGIAAEFGRDVDLHTDETLDPELMTLDDLAERVIASGFPHMVCASHCVSLGMQVEDRQHEIAAHLAQAGISVVALPQTNLYLQGREHQHAMPRALTAVKALLAAGVNVCAGADNLQDPFNPVGRGDPLETASLMVMVAHLLPQQALKTVSVSAVVALTGRARSIVAGEPAELVALVAESAREAIAFAPPGRLVIHNGRLLSPTAPPPPPPPPQEFRDCF